MSEPLEARPDAQGEPAEQTVPAADAGPGAPAPAPGFGVAGEEPDTAEDEPSTPSDAPEPAPGNSTFRTPDPSDVGLQYGR